MIQSCDRQSWVLCIATKRSISTLHFGVVTGMWVPIWSCAVALATMPLSSGVFDILRLEKEVKLGMPSLASNPCLSLCFVAQQVARACAEHASGLSSPVCNTLRLLDTIGSWRISAHNFWNSFTKPRDQSNILATEGSTGRKPDFDLLCMLLPDNAYGSRRTPPLYCSCSSNQVISQVMFPLNTREVSLETKVLEALTRFVERLGRLIPLPPDILRRKRYVRSD